MRSAARATRVLVLSPSPDDRPSTKQLRELVDELRSRPGVRVDTWFLRCAWNEVPWPGSRVVDELRTWLPSRVAALAAGEQWAARLRGARLRWWLLQVRPDVVVLDDGFGERVLEREPTRTARVVRLNSEPPADAHLERAATRVDLALVHSSAVAAVPEGIPALSFGSETKQRSLTLDYSDPELYRSVRRELDLPDEVPLVAGWGDDGWLDGPDVFVRALWFLEHRHGRRAHGVWFGLTGDRDEERRIREEAERCGVADRLHLRPAFADAGLVGDVVFLPYRAGEEPEEETDLLDLAATGAAIVTFPLFESTDPSIRVVGHLDVEGAASHLAELLDEDRRDRARTARRRLDVRGLADAVLGLAPATS